MPADPAASADPAAAADPVTCGDLLREARRRQRLSQLDLATKVGASQRHLSFVETGRASASRGMLIALADALGMSPAGCNQLLLASGFAPRYGQRPIDDRTMAPIRLALDHLLRVHDPYPAWVLDPAWNIIDHNRGADRLLVYLTGTPLSARPAPVNILEAILHPDGLRRVIVNFDDVAAHLYHQTRAEASQSPLLAQQLVRIDPLWPLSVTGRVRTDASGPPRSPVLATTLSSPDGPLSFFSTFTTFGTPLDITVASLRVEHQFAADEATAGVIRRLARADA